MPVEMAAFIAWGCDEGLDYVHRRTDTRGTLLNIVHRGISPENILVSYEGEVKIVDFGMAKAANQSHVTEPGIVKGRAGYMSPEQLRGQRLDRRTDIFAVGVALFEALSGRRPFSDDLLRRRPRRGSALARAQPACP